MSLLSDFLSILSDQSQSKPPTFQPLMSSRDTTCLWKIWYMNRGPKTGLPCPCPREICIMCICIFTLISEIVLFFRIYIVHCTFYLDLSWNAFHQYRKKHKGSISRAAYRVWKNNEGEDLENYVYKKKKFDKKKTFQNMCQKILY